MSRRTHYSYVGVDAEENEFAGSHPSGGATSMLRMRTLGGIAVVFFVTAIGAMFYGLLGSSIADVPPPLPLQTSPTDVRSYETLQLQNGLDVILVSDSKADSAAAALSVSVGHFADPDLLPGLAHFCEHMLFMGSSKYPGENEYNEYLAQHGGYSNAYTASEMTNYFFSVVPDALEGALDIFAQFFISPLFSESGVGREVKAVDSEHDKNKQSDGWRLENLKRGLARPDHPLHKFGTGNLDTLETIPMEKGLQPRDELLKFYKEHYSANRMKLVIYGKQPLATLRNWAETSFSAIPNWNSSVPVYDADPIDSASLPVELHYAPVQDQRTLAMFFPLHSPPHKHFLTKEHSYVSHLLGHEAEGSVAAYLKKKGLAESLYAGVDWDESSFGSFEVVIYLTEEGMRKTDEVVEAVFAFTKIAREQPQQWIWEESRNVAQMQFRFKEKGEPVNEASGLAASMQVFPLPYVIAAPYTYQSYDEEAIKDVLGQINPDNMILMVGSWEEAKKNLDESDPWYGTKYSRAKPSDALLKRWREAAPVKELHLVAPNKFIPTDFDLLHGPGKGYDDARAVPHELVQKDGRWLWYLEDTIFGRPKVYYDFEITLERTSAHDPFAAVCSSLFSMLFDFHLEAITYNARVAGLGFAVAPSFAGLQVSFHGYNDKIDELIDIVLDALAHFKVDPERLQLKKEELQRDLENTKLGQPYQTAFRAMAEGIDRVAWPLESLLAALANGNIDAELDQWIEQVLTGGGGIVGLAHGNVDKDTAIKVFDRVSTALHCGSRPGKKLWPQHVNGVAKLDTKAGLVYARNHPNPKDPNSALELYYQAGPQGQDAEDDIKMMLMHQIAKEPCFDTLRTQQTLGYIVACRVRQGSGAQGISVVIQSNTHLPNDLDQRARTFLSDLLANMTDITADTFENHRAALNQMILEKPKSLRELNGRIWGEIILARFDFDRRAKLASALEHTSLPDTIAYSTQTLNIQKSFSIWVFNGTMPADPETELAADLDDRQLLHEPEDYKKTIASPDDGYYSRWPLHFP